MTKKVNQARQELIKLSKAAKAKQKELEALGGDVPTINEILMSVHKKATGGREFKTFRQWRDDGFKVKKNESSIRIWGKPKKAKRKTEGSDENEFEFYPMCCLFHEGQVEFIESEDSNQANKREDNNKISKDIRNIMKASGWG